MKNISVLIKPASSMCNLRCKYCFYANISSLREVKCHGIMDFKMTQKIIDNLYSELKDGDSIRFAFQGGEPTIAGIEYFENFIKLIKEKNKNILVSYALQTNGTLIDEKWCKLFKENNFLIGLSIDGYEKSHNINRLDEFEKGTYEKVIATKRLFDKYDIEYNILTVLTEQIAKKPAEVFDFIKKKNIRYIQFIPCLDELDAVEKSEYALTPRSFFYFYSKIFELWKKEFKNGNYISIKLIDDVFNLFVKREVNSCGLVGNCTNQLIIESDGSIYPCDFYALDEYRLGNISKQKISELEYNKIAQKFISSRPITKLPNYCHNCKYKNICRGGCKRMADAMYIQDNNFCGYKTFLDIFIPEINWILDKSKYYLID